MPDLKEQCTYVEFYYNLGKFASEMQEMKPGCTVVTREKNSSTFSGRAYPFHIQR
jgi:hypothetical protein